MKIVKSEQNYIVELDEAEWYQKTPEERDVLLEAWRVDAEGQNCRHVVVFVNPDPILPVFGIDRRTRVHSEKLAGGTPYDMCITYHAELVTAAWDAMSEKDRLVILREIRENFAKRGHRNPGRYEITLDRNGVREHIERGRV